VRAHRAGLVQIPASRQTWPAARIPNARRHVLGCQHAWTRPYPLPGPRMAPQRPAFGSNSTRATGPDRACRRCGA
jgi:hypothetical protein